jgi:multidrug efflux pump subunit AcrB
MAKSHSISIRFTAGILLLLLALYVQAEPVVAKQPGPGVQVLTFHPGMPAASVEKEITNRLERWVNQAESIRRIESHTIAGVSIVRVWFHDDVAPAAALVQVNSLALATLPTLPPSTLPPLVIPLNQAGTRPVAFLAIDNPALSEVQLKDLAVLDVRNDLARIDGCVTPVVLGGKDRILTITLEPRRLEACKLSPLDVVQALRKANRPVMPANAQLGDKQMALVIAGAEGIAELGKVPIRVKPGESLFLRDVARVEDAFAEQTSLVRINGRRGVVIPIECRGDVRALKERLAKARPRLESRLPKESKLSLYWLGDESKGGSIAIHLRAPSGLVLAATEKRVAEVERFLEKNIPAAERTAMIAEVGVQFDRSAVFSRNACESDAMIHVSLSGENAQPIAERIAKLRRLFGAEKSFADLRVCLDGGNEDSAILVRITGNKPTEQAKLAREVRNRLARIRGAVDVEVVQRVDAPQLLIEVDSEKSRRLRLSAQEVIAQVSATLNPGGLNAGFWIDSPAGHRLLLAVRSIEGIKGKVEELLNVVAQTPKGGDIKLSNLVTLTWTMTAVEIDHSNLRPVFDVRVNTEGRDRTEVMAEIEKLLKEVRRPAGIEIEVEEQTSRKK